MAREFHLLSARGGVKWNWSHPKTTDLFARAKYGKDPRAKVAGGNTAKVTSK